jgi:hypothetical protein
MSQKSFVLEDSTIGVKGIRCMATTPIAAAKKLAKELFALASKGKHKLLRKIHLTIKSGIKTYTYASSKVKNNKDKYSIIVKPHKPSFKKRRVGGDNPISPKELQIKDPNKNYILITDIGRDIDDTFALIALLYKHCLGEINLLAVVVSGGNLLRRAKCVSYWLSRFGLNNKTIPIIYNEEEEFKFDTKSSDYICVMPYKQYGDKGIETEDEIKYKALFEEQKCDKTLIEFLNTTEATNINILSIGFVRPLYNAMKNNNKIVNKIDAVFFQGNAYYHENKIHADNRPTIGAYNFGSTVSKEIGEIDTSDLIRSETQFVIDIMMENNKKLYFVGKETTYLIRFHKDDLGIIGDNELKESAIKKVLKFAAGPTNHIFNRVFKDDFNKVEIINFVYECLQAEIDDLMPQSQENGKIMLEKQTFIQNYHKDVFVKRYDDNFQFDQPIKDKYNNFITTKVDTDDINNNYTKKFLKTLLKITNPYDLVLVYLALYPEFFNEEHAYFYQGNDVAIDSNFKNVNYIQFNKRDPKIFDKKKDKEEYVHAHMIELMKQAVVYTNTNTKGGRYQKKSSKSKPKSATKKSQKSNKSKPQKPKN